MLTSPGRFLGGVFRFLYILCFVETAECQGFQLSRYAAELAEREGIDVRLIKRMLDLTPRERIEESQKDLLTVAQLEIGGELEGM